MPATKPISVFLPSPEDTGRLAVWLAPHLQAGDTVLLEGPIGAGKSHFARALIRARLGRQEEVPSPSFTLVQTYPDPDGDIWHADLYRLSHPDEVQELGLEEAFVTAICLIEWPDRLGKALPPNPVTLRLSLSGEGRQAVLDPGQRPELRAEFAAWCDRDRARTALLGRAGWGDADRHFLAGDASDRSYDRLNLGDKTAVLMDAPPGKGDDPATFLAVADHLLSLGLSAPRLLGKDLTHGLLLLEDLGDGVFAKILADDSTLERQLYMAATDVLLHLQARPAAPDLPNLTAHQWADAACLSLDWYAFAIAGRKPDPAAFREALAAALQDFSDGPRVMILRDYHAENLIWLPHRSGMARVGLLDFQLAQLGQPGYDLVSLLQDARREVTPDVEAAMIRHFADRKGVDIAEFQRSYAVLGAQRALRIIGIFARLCLVSAKPGYVSLVPRVWGHLQRCLAHPDLAQLAAICHDLLPPPTPDALKRIGDQCGNFR